MVFIVVDESVWNCRPFSSVPSKCHKIERLLDRLAIDQADLEGLILIVEHFELEKLSLCMPDAYHCGFLNRINAIPSKINMIWSVMMN